MESKEISIMAEYHWTYVESVLIAHEIDRELIDMCGFHYQSAFIHGFKHGVEDTKQ